MRMAIPDERSMASGGPDNVSVSPRSVTLTLPTRDSSTRLASFTPASVSGSAPSVDRRCVTSSSLTFGILDADVQVVEILRGDDRGRALQQRARRGRLWKRDHVAKRAGSGELHRDAVEAERDAASPRCAGSQPVEEKTESGLRRRLV